MGAAPWDFTVEALSRIDISEGLIRILPSIARSDSGEEVDVHVDELIFALEPWQWGMFQRRTCRGARLWRRIGYRWRSGTTESARMDDQFPHVKDLSGSFRSIQPTIPAKLDLTGEKSSRFSKLLPPFLRLNSLV
jgi:hypothetical protein